MAPRGSNLTLHSYHVTACATIHARAGGCKHFFDFFIFFSTRSGVSIEAGTRYGGRPTKRHYFAGQWFGPGFSLPSPAGDRPLFAAGGTTVLPSADHRKPTLSRGEYTRCRGALSERAFVCIIILKEGVRVCGSGAEIRDAAAARRQRVCGGTRPYLQHKKPPSRAAETISLLPASVIRVP